MQSDADALISCPSLNASEVLDSSVSMEARFGRAAPEGGREGAPEQMLFGLALCCEWAGGIFPSQKWRERRRGGLKQRKGPGGWPTRTQLDGYAEAN